MRPSRIVVAALLAASFVAGCNKQTTPAANPTTAAAASGAQCELPPETVVGTYKLDGAEQKLTYGELTSRIGAPLADLEKKKQELLKRGLEGYVIEKLVQVYLEYRDSEAERFIDVVWRIGIEPFKEHVYGTHHQRQERRNRSLVAA